MGARKDKRRKLARKVVARYIADGLASPWSAFDGELTDPLTAREYILLVDEIRAAKVTVTWGDK
jgi:hypothetical protein